MRNLTGETFELTVYASGCAVSSASTLVQKGPVRPWWTEVDRVGLGYTNVPGEGNEESFKGKEWQMKKWRGFVGKHTFFFKVPSEGNIIFFGL